MKVGFGIPRKLGEPPAWRQNTHGEMLRLGQKAEALGFDSIWVPDHYFFERPPGAFTPFPEAWTLMTALLCGTRQAQVGSMVIAAGGERMMRLTARYASAFNAAGGGPGGEGFRGKLAELHAACRAIGRDPAEIEITYSATVVVLPDAATTRRAIEVIAAKPPAIPPDEVRARYAIGTPDEVADGLLRTREWGVQHLVLGLGAEPFTLWSEDSLELFAREVLPRLKAAR